MYSHKLQNKISKIVNGLQILSNLNNTQMGGSIIDVKNKYNNKINNKLNEFVKNSTMLLNFDRTIIQKGGKSDLFTNDTNTVETIKEAISKNDKDCTDNINTITTELNRLNAIEIEHTNLGASITAKDAEILQHTQTKTQLESQIQDKDVEIARLQAQIAAGVNDQTALQALQTEIDKLKGQHDDLEKLFNKQELELQSKTKDLIDLTDKYNKVKESRDQLFKQNKETILKYQDKLALADDLFDKYEKCNEGVTNITKPIVARNNFAELSGSV